jgi:hypothetical protein
MTAAPPLAFPGNRTLAGWWRQLTSYQPRTLAVGHLLLHRIEALVRLQRRLPVDPLARLVLGTLSREPPPTLLQIQAMLPMEQPLLRQILHSLETAGLAQCNGTGLYRLTEPGRQAQQHGAFPQSAQERRAFYFLESERPERPPRFVHLTAPATTPWPAQENWKFDTACLTQCLQQPVEWKRRHAFPSEVAEVLMPGPGNAVDPALATWQRVILDQPECLLAVMVQAARTAGGNRVLGFAVQPKGWDLNAGAPTFDVPFVLAELFANHEAEPPLERWLQAWQVWGQHNNLTTAELETSTVERRDHRLRVITSRAVVDRLRSTKSEALRGEAWVLAGGERVRVAAQLEIVEARQKK